jgi:hypothetical protein
MGCWQVTGGQVDDEGYDVQQINLILTANTVSFKYYDLPTLIGGQPTTRGAFKIIVDGSDAYGFYLGSGASANRLSVADCAPTGYDCINDQCLDSKIYKTGGKYPTSAACQAACGKKPCDGECVSPQDMNALEQAANNLISRACG